ncbi:MAG: hypothetical protein ABR553_09060 [Gammaproteobacteria bacterium]
MRSTFGLALAAAIAIPFPALADLETEAYIGKGSALSEAERARVQAEIARDIALEQEKDQARLAQERALEQARTADLAARPWPVQLLERRCTVCHAADYYQTKTYSRLRWELVILRMQWQNDTPLEPGERGLLATHLATSQPATGTRALSEALLLVVAPLTLMGGALYGAWRAWRWRGRARRSTATSDV